MLYSFFKDITSKIMLLCLTKTLHLVLQTMGVSHISKQNIIQVKILMNSV